MRLWIVESGHQPKCRNAGQREIGVIRIGHQRPLAADLARIRLGWQVAADANTAGSTYPDQNSLSVQFGTGSLSPYQPGAPARRPDRMRRGEARNGIGSCQSLLTLRQGSAVRWTPLEIMKAYVAAGAAAVHFEDQLHMLEKKCGHLGGKGSDFDIRARAQPGRGATCR